jgi:hypothetical protein
MTAPPHTSPCHRRAVRRQPRRPWSRRGLAPVAAASFTLCCLLAAAALQAPPLAAQQPMPAPSAPPSGQAISGAQGPPPTHAAPGSTPSAGSAPASLPASGSATASPMLPTVKDVLARSLEACGGRAKLSASETRRETGRLSLAPGTEWPFTIEHKRPRNLRMEIDLQGTKLVRVYDGLHAWQLQPQKKVAEEMGLDDRRNIANESDFDFFGPLIDTNIKGRAELLDRETVDGHDAYRLKVTLLDGDVFTYDIDAATYLPIHSEGARWINGKPTVFESTYADYREVDGIKYPFLIQLWVKGSTQKQKRTFTKIENNPPIADSRFSMPADAIPAPPPAHPSRFITPPATVVTPPATTSAPATAPPGQAPSPTQAPSLPPPASIPAPSSPPPPPPA